MNQFQVESKLLRSVPNLQHGFLSRWDSPELVTEISRSTFLPRQIHTAELFWLEESPPEMRPTADAVATFHRNIFIGVQSADCTPILATAVHADNSAVAVLAIHAGWRGTHAKIAAKALAIFVNTVKQRAMPSRWLAAIGPCISGAVYEVGEDVAQFFADKYKKPLAKESSQKKYLLDITANTIDQMQESAKQLGITLELDQIKECTYSLPQKYPSFRRDGPRPERILSVIRFV